VLASVLQYEEVSPVTSSVVDNYQEGRTNFCLSDEPGRGTGYILPNV
jgi:hypothetical protein